MHSDFLVIGSGLAGLTFALKAAQHGSVIVLTKDRMPESATAYAQGGIASVWSSDDSFEEHSQDTMTAGANLCHQDIVDLVVREGPECVRELITLGTQFSTRPGADGEYDLGREGGHSHRRILHASDATGSEIMRALVEAVRRTPNITVLERHLAVDLLVDAKFDASIAQPSCWGAYAFDQSTGTIQRFQARSTRATPTSLPVTASPWRIAPAYRSATWSSSNSIPPACTTRKPSPS
jgi:L-aspartate oxidase